MKLNSIYFKNILFSFFIVLLISSCGNQKEEGENAKTNAVDSNRTQLLNVNGEIFSIPSPIQTAFLIKKSGANYTKEMLNPAQKSSGYSTTFQKALNLGIYGADLGYVTLYDQTQDAIAYMQSVKKIADDLGVTGAFDAQIINRFQNNIGNKDSLLVLVSTAYRSSDAYLKNNDRSDISGLVLAGGWIEGIHFAIDFMKTKKNDDVRRRIAEQKISLQSLVKLLIPYSSQPEYNELIDALNELTSLFEGVEFKYVYEKPTVDPSKKLTTINSKTSVSITDEQLNAISQKIQSIRNQIVG